MGDRVMLTSTFQELQALSRADLRWLECDNRTFLIDNQQTLYPNFVAHTPPKGSAQWHGLKEHREHPTFYCF